MASYNPFYHPASHPINVPRKPGQYVAPQQTIHHPVVGSPPEAAESQSSGPTFDPSATASSYAGSASEYESQHSAGGVDLMDYMNQRVQGSFDPTRLDRGLAKQAQT
jgi:biogenesis of lysosome-related organelles complex 1 subunit KXD1